MRGGACGPPAVRGLSQKRSKSGQWAEKPSSASAGHWPLPGPIREGEPNGGVVMRLFCVAALAAGLVGLTGATAQQPPAGQPPAGQPAKGKVKSVIKVTVPTEKA